MNGPGLSTGAIQALGVLLPVLYLAVTALYGMHFGGEDAPAVRRPRRIAVVLALGSHALFFALFAAATRAFPTVDAWTTTSAIAFVLALLYLLTTLRTQDEGAGAVVFGVVALLQLGASAFGPLAPRADGSTLEPAFLVHALTSIAAAAALVLSGLHGSLYLFVLRRMRKGRFGPAVQRMPNLRRLGLLTRRAALAGFLLLTIGLNVGIGLAHYTDVTGFHYTDPSVIVMLGLWLHFGVVAFSRQIPGFSAKRASFAAALGLSIFLAAGLVTMLPRASFHWAQ